MFITLVRESKKKPTVNNRLDSSTISRNLIYRISDYIWEVDCNLKKKNMSPKAHKKVVLFCLFSFVFLRTQLHLKFLAFFELSITSFYIVLECFLFILSCKNNNSPRWMCRWVKLMILIYSEPFVPDTNEKQAVSEG